jgi:hypothetical protein
MHCMYWKAHVVSTSEIRITALVVSDGGSTAERNISIAFGLLLLTDVKKSWILYKKNIQYFNKHTVRLSSSRRDINVNVCRFSCSVLFLLDFNQA